jgi:hypothetical protein
LRAPDQFEINQHASTMEVPAPGNSIAFDL